MGLAIPCFSSKKFILSSYNNIHTVILNLSKDAALAICLAMWRRITLKDKTRYMSKEFNYFGHLPVTLLSVCQQPGSP